jgi:hypothetical protein
MVVSVSMCCAGIQPGIHCVGKPESTGPTPGCNRGDSQQLQRSGFQYAAHEQNPLLMLACLRADLVGSRRGQVSTATTCWVRSVARLKL